MSALTQIVSPTTRFTAYRPPSNSGATHSIVRGSRPRAGERRSRLDTTDGLGASGYGLGNKDVLTEVEGPPLPSIWAYSVPWASEGRAITGLSSVSSASEKQIPRRFAPRDDNSAQGTR